jgi:hypothetical protein
VGWGGGVSGGDRAGGAAGGTGGEANVMREGKSLLFLKKKKQKDFYSLMPWQAVAGSDGVKGTKVFCFFFSKKKTFLSMP